MLQYEQIREMPLKDLLVYFNALQAICNKHELELRPLFNSQDPKEQVKWAMLNNEYQHAKMYCDVVLNAMKYQAYHGLDEYTKPEEQQKLKAKKPVVKRTTKPKKTTKKKNAINQ